MEDVWRRHTVLDVTVAQSQFAQLNEPSQQVNVVGAKQVLAV